MEMNEHLEHIVQMERDAKRYRWLRDGGDGPANAIAAAVAEGDNEHGGEYVSWLYGDELDKAIDAAMNGANVAGKAHPEAQP